MNILVFSWRGPKHPQAGGAEQVMHEHMKGWVKEGYKVTLFTSAYKGCLSEEYIGGVKVIRKGRQIFGVQIEGFKYYLKHRRDYDFIVDQFHGIPFFTPLYVNKPKLAVLQEVTREIWFLNGFRWPLNWLIGLTGYLVEPLIFLFYRKTKFMVGSNSAKEDLMGMGINKSSIEVVPHGVIAKIPDKIIKEKIKTISFLGALTEDKGVYDAISTFGLLNEYGKFNFWVIGKGPGKVVEKLKLISKDVGVEKNITFWGWVDEKKKFELLTRSHILINPSIREGWGLVNIEANSVETPVVAYASRGLVDSVRDGMSGIIVKEKTPEALALAVKKVLEDEKYFKKLQKTSVDWSNNFSWEISRQKSINLIRKIINS